MRVEQLECLVAVVEHGSLRRAAAQVHLSQPALSEAISKLEVELGTTLLERRRSGTVVSATGRELLDAVGDVLDAVDRLRALAAGAAVTGRAVRVGSVDAATSSLLVPAVRGVTERDPAARVEVHDLQQEAIVRGLLEGSLDLGLVNLLPGEAEPAGVRATPLLRGRPVVVLPTGHPLADAPAVEPDDLRTQRFVAMRDGYAMHRYAAVLFGDRPPAPAYTADGAAKGKAVVADGLGVTLLPDYSVLDDPLLRAGLVTTRPVAGDDTVVTLALLRPSRRTRGRVDDLVEALLARAAEVARG